MRALLAALLLAGCATHEPVPPEVRARGEAMLVELRALDTRQEVVCLNC